MTTIVLVNLSTSPALTPAWLDKVARALATQLARDFCPDHELAPWDVTTDQTRPGPRLYLFDHGTQAGILGFHAADPNGNPYGRVFCDGCTLPEIERTISHEGLELRFDETARGYEFPAVGPGLAREVCDAVEDQEYVDAETGVHLSDYVLPAWFVAFSAGPWNKLGNLPGPLTRTAQGYRITMTAGAVATDPPEAAMRPGKTHEASRTGKRLAMSAPATTAGQ